MARNVTAEQREERICFAVEHLSRMATKGEVVAAIYQKFKLKSRSANLIITQAKARICEATGKAADEHINEAYAFYRSVIRNGNTDERERIRAREACDKLLGIQGKAIKPAAAGVTEDQLKEIISNVTLDVLQFLAALNPSLRDIIAAKHVELATFIDQKYGTAGEASKPN